MTSIGTESVNALLIDPSKQTVTEVLIGKRNPTGDLCLLMGCSKLRFDGSPTEEGWAEIVVDGEALVKVAPTFFNFIGSEGDERWESKPLANKAVMIGLSKFGGIAFTPCPFELTKVRQWIRWPNSGDINWELFGSDNRRYIEDEEKAEMSINPKQRKILIAGAVLFIVMCLIPPWTYTFHSETFQSEKPAGYSLIIDTPPPEHTGRAYGIKVDLSLLLLQLMGLGAAVGLGFWLAKEPGQNA